MNVHSCNECELVVPFSCLQRHILSEEKMTGMTKQGLQSSYSNPGNRVSTDPTMVVTNLTAAVFQCKKFITKERQAKELQTPFEIFLQ